MNYLSYRESTTQQIDLHTCSLNLDTLEILSVLHLPNTLLAAHY
jgi:hypothetical protein